MILKKLLKNLRRQEAVPKWLAVSFIIFALIGFADASFLTIEHYRGTVPPCVILKGCATVTTSQYSVIFGIPVALIGALYYLTLLLLFVGYIESHKPAVAWIAFQLTPFGVFASLYFTYLQLNVIQAWCVYCILSIVSTISLFVLGNIGLRYQKHSLNEPEIPTT